MRDRFLGSAEAGDVAVGLALLAASLDLPDPGRGPTLDATIDEALAERDGWRPPGAPPVRVPEVVALLAAIPPASWPGPPAVAEASPVSPPPPPRRARGRPLVAVSVLVVALAATGVSGLLAGVGRPAAMAPTDPGASFLRVPLCPARQVCYTTSDGDRRMRVIGVRQHDRWRAVGTSAADPAAPRPPAASAPP